jgi:hypothetical protein
MPYPLHKIPMQKKTTHIEHDLTSRRTMHVTSAWNVTLFDPPVLLDVTSNCQGLVKVTRWFGRWVPVISCVSSANTRIWGHYDDGTL